MKKILCLFDYGPADVTMTGYATVSRNIVAQVKKRFEANIRLDIIAINYFGEPYKEYEDSVKVVSAAESQRKLGIATIVKDGGEFGRMSFLKELEDGDYDGIFILQDLGTVAGMVPLIRMIRDRKYANQRKTFKSIIYFPVDGPIQERVKNKEFDKGKLSKWPKEYQKYFKEDIVQLDELEFFDMAVTYTKYGQKEIAKLKPPSRLIVANLYHGINLQEFYPMEVLARNNFRRNYFKQHAQNYIVGVINRNQPRKDIPTAIFGYMHARENWDKSIPAPFLYLHMNPVDPKGWDLYKLLNSLGLIEGKDYMFPRDADKNGQVDVEILNGIYNSIDVYLSTSRGEGWGLTATEAMACKVPCILPDHTSLGEIGADHRALLLKEFLPVCDTVDNTERDMCHFEEVGEAIQDMARRKYNSGEFDKNYTENAYEFVAENSWEDIGFIWGVWFGKIYGIENLSNV